MHGRLEIGDSYLNSQGDQDVGAEGWDSEGTQVLDALSCEDLCTSLEPHWLLKDHISLSM